MQNKEKENREWNLIIEPKRGIFAIPIKEIQEYKDLIFLFVKRDFVIKYKQTILGPIWYVISPLIQAITYSFIFGRLAGLTTGGIPHLLFYYAGTILWDFFATSFSDAANIFVNNVHIFGKVYFPRLVMPISNVIGTLIKISIQLLCLLSFYLYYAFMQGSPRPSIYLLCFPLILLWLAILANGLGMIISSITTKYKDLRLLMEFALSLAMYATAVVYPISQIPEKYAWLSYVNPINAPMELSRIALYGVGNLNIWMLISSIGQTIIFFLLGLISFNQNERNFIDVL